VSTESEELQRKDAEIERLRTFLRVSQLMNAETSKARLINKINETVRGYLEADRFTVFFHDSETDELYSYVASGVKRGEIRFPSTQGVAGSVFQSGETLIIDDAYHDDRFNPEIDRRTGYHTDSLLSVPIVNRKGVRIGVVQALNKQTGEKIFTPDDLDFVQELVAQISDLLDLLLHKEALARQHAAMQEALSHLKVYEYLIGEKTATKMAMRWSRKLHIWVSMVFGFFLFVMTMTGIFVAHGSPMWQSWNYGLHTGKIVLGDWAFAYSDLVGVALALVTITGGVLWAYPYLSKKARARVKEKVTD